MTDDFARRYGPWALIAGASEGIGACMVDEVARRGLNVVLVARNAALLSEVADRARADHGAETLVLPADLTDPATVDRIAEGVDGREIGLLLYNAGASDRTTFFLENSYEYSLKQIQLDVVGPTALARLFAPPMVERGRGGIVVVSSLACLAGSATLTMYSAVKAFQHNFAEGLWAELHPAGVDVVCTPLGMTFTPALQRMGVDYDPQTQMLSEDVAREIVENIGNGPVHVVGENNRAAASAVWTIDRRALVQMMTTASMDFASKRKG